MCAGEWNGCCIPGHCTAGRVRQGTVPPAISGSSFNLPSGSSQMAGSGQLRSREPAALRASRMQTGTRNLYQQTMCGRLQTETAAAFVADLPSETSKARMPSGALQPGFLQRRIFRIIPGIQDRTADRGAEPHDRRLQMTAVSGRRHNRRKTVIQKRLKNERKNREKGKKKK